jgi:hypothetical protein
MKNIRNTLLALLFTFIAFPYSGSSQGNLTTEPGYEVNRIYPYISIAKEKLGEARTLTDLDPKYNSSWIREYISVEVVTIYKGKTRSAVSKSDVLSREQKDIMNMADAGTDISVNIQYIPENTLTHNDIKEINFTFSIDPESEAQYIGGQQELNKYLKTNAIDKIPEGSFRGYDLAAVKFTVSEEGEITDAHIFERSKDKNIDELLLKAIHNMPNWKPAEYANGVKTKQVFVLTVGNMENCMVNLLNIRRD